MPYAGKTQKPHSDTSHKGAAGESAAAFSEIHDSPRMVTQRRQLQSLFGSAAQLQLPLENEAPLVPVRFDESPRMQTQLAQLRHLFGHSPAGVVQRSSEKVTMNLGEDQDRHLSGHGPNDSQDDAEVAKAIDARGWLDMSAPVAARFWELVHENHGIDEPPDATIQTAASVKGRLHELFDDDPSIDVDELQSLQLRLTRSAPTDEQMIAYALASASGEDAEGYDDAVALVRDQLLGWLMQIAVHDILSLIHI